MKERGNIWEKPVRLSERMNCVASMVSPGGRVCDVGCDHGFVSIYLVQNQLASKVFAMDVGEGPLSRAKAHISEYGLDDRIETRLSDGLCKISEDDRVDTVIMAGMGGLLIQRIIHDALQRNLVIREFVLQPQSAVEQLRFFLRTHAYVVTEEDMILEDGKYYPVMKVCRQSTLPTGATGKENVMLHQDSEQQRLMDIFGPLLLTQKHPVLLSYLMKEKEKFEQISMQMKQRDHMDPAVEDRLAVLNEALRIYEIA